MNMHDYNTARTNLYPLRSNTTPQLNMVSNANQNGFGGIGAQSNPMIYRRSLESCSNNMMYQQMQHLPAQSTLPPLKPVINQTPNKNLGDVLTICAGTQTDASLDSPTNLHTGTLSNLASKKDVDEVRQMLEEMKHEQQRIVKMLETLLFSPQQQQQITVKPQSKDIGVQVDCIENDKSPYVNGGIVLTQDQPDNLQQSVPKNKFLQHLKPNNNILQTPKGKPMAQSTTYRPNSPQRQRFEQDLPEMASAPIYQQVNCKPHPVMHKSASDTSLAMNELALKYLPNEKLAELLNELNMDCPLAATANGKPSLAASNVPTTPIKGNVDKFEKGPSDISNASYKYLKKYRLLPEDHVANDGNGGVEGNMENANENQMPEYNSPQYNNIRNTPIHQRQTPTNKCSPYSGRLPLSPLARASPPHLQSAVPQHNVNLENIKYQPKFL
ncbi:uncharacterized protein ana2 [Calliphora vicina]|uniref:uncharacterized protein ana2 n=1 Tax=Calliphora vicina TaxID=7373 RepID=UPI00325BB08E